LGLVTSMQLYMPDWTISDRCLWASSRLDGPMGATTESTPSWTFFKNWKFFKRNNHPIWLDNWIRLKSNFCCQKWFLVMSFVLYFWLYLLILFRIVYLVPKLRWTTMWYKFFWIINDSVWLFYLCKNVFFVCFVENFVARIQMKSKSYSSCIYKPSTFCQKLENWS